MNRYYVCMFAVLLFLRTADGQLRDNNYPESCRTEQVIPGSAPRAHEALLKPASFCQRGSSRLTQQRSHAHEVSRVAFSADAGMVACLFRNERRICLWETATGRSLGALWVDGLTPDNLAFSSDIRSLLVAATDAIVRVDLATGRHIARYALNEEGKAHYGGPIIDITEDGHYLRALSAFAGGNEIEDRWALHAWDVRTGKRLHSNPFGSETIWTCYGRFSADGRVLLLPNGNIHNAINGDKLLRLSAEGNNLMFPVGFSPDAAFVATGIQPEMPGAEELPYNTSVQVWELPTCLPVARLKTGHVTYLALASNGRKLVTVGIDTIQLWDVVQGKVERHWSIFGRQSTVEPSFASACALASSGQTLATGQPSGTVVLWDMVPQPGDRFHPKLSAGELEACWDQLLGADARLAVASQARLADVPKQAVELLRDRLQPAPGPASVELQPLLAALDDSRYAVREAATQRLIHLGPRMESRLQDALRGPLSPEATRRLQRILAAIIAEPFRELPRETRRAVRAVRVLEWVGTSSAARVLEQLANGAPEAVQTQAAHAAVVRCRSRMKTSP